MPNATPLPQDIEQRLRECHYDITQDGPTAPPMGEYDEEKLRALIAALAEDAARWAKLKEMLHSSTINADTLAFLVDATRTPEAT